MRWLRLIPVLVLVLLSQVLAQTQPWRQRIGANQIPNPGFNGTTNWFMDGNASYDATKTRTADGSGSIRFGHATARVWQSTQFPVTPGKSYTFAVYMRTETWPSPMTDFAIGLYNAAGVNVVNQFMSHAANSAPGLWEEITATVTAEPGHAYAQIIIHRLYEEPAPNAFMWLDDAYFGEGVGFGSPPTAKIPFDGVGTKIDSLGNVTINKGGTFVPVFPFCIYGDGRGGAARWQTYSNQGFNCEMWGDHTTLPWAAQAVSSFNPQGMMAGAQIAQYMNAGSWGWDLNGANLTNLVNALKATGYFQSHFLWYYWDNENIFAGRTDQMRAAAQFQAADKVGGLPAHPVYGLQGSCNVARSYHDSPNIHAMGMTGAYAGAYNTGAAGAAGCLENLQNLEHQDEPVVVFQNNIVFRGSAAGGLRAQLYQGLTIGAKAIGLWRDCFAAGAPEPQDCQDVGSNDVTTVAWWPDVPFLRAELDAMLPLIRQPHWTTWTVTYNSALPLQVSTRDYTGRGHLIVLNTSASPVTVTFTLSGLGYTPQMASNYFTGASVANISGNTFQMTLPALGINSGTAVVRLDGPAAPVPVLTSAATANGTVGTAFSYQITATNSPTSYGATGLPAGLSVNTSTGLLSGTPTVAGTSTVTLQATNASGTGSLALTLTVAAPTAPTLRALNVHTGAPSDFFADEAWDGIGLDDTGRVYAAFSSFYTPGSPGDVGIVRYTPNTDTMQWMSWVSTIAANANNLQAGERFAKIHADFRPWQGKVYFATHDFHDTTQPSEVRGSHVMVYDPATNTFDDLSRFMANGVAVQQQGIIGMDIEPTTGMLIGMTYPLGDLVRVPLASATPNATLTQHRGFGQVTRKVLATTQGSGYFAYYPDAENTPLYAITASNGVIRTTAQTVLYGIWQGRVVTRDQQTAYLADEIGHIYRFTVATEQLTDLGYLTGQTWHDQYGATETLTMSNDERYLFAWISCWWCSTPQGVLFSYEIATGARAIEAQFFSDARGWDRRVTALVTDHLGNIYVLDHAPSHIGEGRLLQISGVAHSPSRTTTPPTITSASTASGTVGSAFTYQITATQNPTSYQATGLPAGLSVNTATGLISGTPTAGGTFTPTLRAANADGAGTLLLTLTISSPPLPDQLFLHWRLDQATNQTVVDSGTCGCPGTPQNGPTQSGGRLGTALAFNGLNQSVHHATVNWPAAQPYTIHLWVYTDGGTENGSFGFGGSSDPRIGAHIPWSDNRLYWDGGDAGPGRTELDYTPYLHRWTHVTFRYNGANQRRIYIDGVLKVENLASGPVPGALTGLELGSWRIGTLATYYQTGRLDNFQIYTGVRSDAEILANFHAGAKTVAHRGKIAQ